MYQKLITFKPFCFPLSAVKCSSKMFSLSLILHLIPLSTCSFPKNPHQNQNTHTHTRTQPHKKIRTEQNKEEKKPQNQANPNHKKPCCVLPIHNMFHSLAVYLALMEILVIAHNNTSEMLRLQCLSKIIIYLIWNAILCL